MAEDRFLNIPETELKKRFEILKTLQDVEPIEEGGLVPTTADDLDRIVEEPLLEACKIFFNKGIKTVMSSANRKDIESSEVHVVIEYDSLSEENKEIAERYAVPYTHLNTSYVKFIRYVTSSTTIKSISKHMVQIATAFEDQTSK